MRKKFIFVLLSFLIFNLSSKAQNSFLALYENSTIVEDKNFEFIEFPMPIKTDDDIASEGPFFIKEIKTGHLNVKSLTISNTIDCLRIYHNYKNKFQELGYTILAQHSSVSIKRPENEFRGYWSDDKGLKNLFDDLTKFASVSDNKLPNLYEHSSDNSSSGPIYFILAEKKTNESEILTYIATTKVPDNSKKQSAIVIVTLEKALNIPKDQISKTHFLNAAEIKDALNSQGKASIYNIYFDFNEASLKTESEPAIVEIAKYLKENPNEKLIVTGHTDNIGSFVYNIELSQKRAFAVLGKLIKEHNIEAKRLLGFGAGMAAPISNNATEEDRAKNRRVELVKWTEFTPSQEQEKS
jgi:OOP family OmpA-OmpF porin